MQVLKMLLMQRLRKRRVKKPQLILRISNDDPRPAPVLLNPQQLWQSARDNLTQAHKPI